MNSKVIQMKAPVQAINARRGSGKLHTLPSRKALPALKRAA